MLREQSLVELNALAETRRLKNKQCTWVEDMNVLEYEQISRQVKAKLQKQIH